MAMDLVETGDVPLGSRLEPVTSSSPALEDWFGAEDRSVAEPSPEPSGNQLAGGIASTTWQRLVRQLALVPGVAAVNRRLFRFALDRRRDLRRALRPFRKQSLLSNDVVMAVLWPWYRFRFRFSRVRVLRQLQFLLRDKVGGGHRAVVPRHTLLLGGWNGMSGFDFALRSSKLLDPSTRLEDSFYDELLSSYDEKGEAALDEDNIRASGYFQRIHMAATLSGHYRGVDDVPGLVQVTREYLDRYRGLPVKYRPGRSRLGTLPRVRRIVGSDYYSVLDGHHRLAIEMHKGAQELDVVVAPGSTSTYLQKLLLDMSWLDGSRRLYQPVDFPEVQNWPLMRKCHDRLGFMISYLDRTGMAPAGADLSYLDVGSCYGWFVSEMGKRGFAARGLEMDPLALELGPLVYGIDAAQITVGDCVALLSDPAQTADIVSCFSVLHHFVMGRGTSSAKELMRLLATRTGRVLFLDTGQAHESWFRWTLPEWAPAYIASWIKANSDFNRVEAIGVDTDGTGVFCGKFGRTLFACSR
jgi:hypothetical protein